MRRRDRVHLTLILTVAAWLVVAPVADAYVDPGSSSIVFQALIAFAAAAGVALKAFRHRLTGWFRRNDRSDAGSGDGPR